METLSKTTVAITTFIIGAIIGGVIVCYEVLPIDCCTETYVDDGSDDGGKEINSDTVKTSAIIIRIHCPKS